MRTSGIIIICYSIVLNGCFCSSFRDYTTVSTADVGGSISTKYRYRITSIEGKLYDGIGFRIGCFAGGIGGVREYEINTRDFKEKYPNVFSNSGIPMVIKVRPTGDDSGDKYAWTPLLAIPSLMLFPILEHYSDKANVDLTMVEDVAVKDGFEVERVSEKSKSLFLTGLIPFRGVPDCGANRVYWKCDTSIGADGSTDADRREHYYLNSGLQLREGFVYGVAAKLKELEDSGKIDAMLRKLEEAKLQWLEEAKLKAPEHRVVRLAHDVGGDFAYRFTFELLEVPIDPNKAKSAVLQEFGETLKKEYVYSVPGAKQMPLAVNYTDVKIDGKLIQGRAIVFAMSIVSLSYDANTRRGKLSVRFNAGQAEEARTWIRKNIETLARDKNIALTTGTLPPEATYYSLGEKIDGNVMEIEFKTE